MLEGSELVLVTATVFVGTHFILSHPLRRPLVAALGEGIFSALYSVVAVITLGASIWAYRVAPATEPLWAVGDGLWTIATVATLGASILLMGSLIRNPALPGASGLAASAQGRGVYGITRHPMMWAFAVWSVTHIMVFPITKNIIFCSAIMLLALVGAHFQDQKKYELDPDGWAAWKSRTSYWPFVAIVRGRAKFGSFGIPALLAGTLGWLIATWAHSPLAGWPAGIWRWLS